MAGLYIFWNTIFVCKNKIAREVVTKNCDIFTLIFTAFKAFIFAYILIFASTLVSTPAPSLPNIYINVHL